jgi:acetyl esterase/lipase
MGCRRSCPIIFAQYFLATGYLVAVGTTSASAQEAAIVKNTYVYKKIDNLELKADVSSTEGDAVRPVVLWLHGGALILGDRGSTDRVLRQKLPRAGYVFVSVDYRLAPETKMAAILEDIDSAYAWVRAEGPKLFHADPDRIAVMGGSAGGYLSLIAAYREKPAPRAIVSFWGYGDIVGEWYNKPDPFYSRQPAVSKDEAYGSIGKVPVSEPDGKQKRGRFYLYCRQNGLWTKEVAGHDPDKEIGILDAYCPVRNVSTNYPPTFLIHGTKDTDVPYAQTVGMDKELTRVGVPHEFVTIKDGPHGLGGVDKAVVADLYDRVMQFVNKQMDVKSQKTKQ